MESICWQLAKSSWQSVVIANCQLINQHAYNRLGNQ